MTLSWATNGMSGNMAVPHTTYPIELLILWGRNHKCKSRAASPGNGGRPVRRRSGPLAAVDSKADTKIRRAQEAFLVCPAWGTGRLRPTLCPSGCGKSTLLKSIGGGLHRVEFIVADDPAGLRASLREVLPEAAYQRCYITWAS